MFKAENNYSAEFIRTFDASVDMKLWIKLLEEETKELKEALEGTDREHVLKEAADVLYVIAPVMALGQVLYVLGFLSEELNKQAEEKIALVDKYFATVSTMFSEKTVAEALKLVHESNMSKLDEDGKPIRREDGKILKSNLYKEPNLKHLV